MPNPSNPATVDDIVNRWRPLSDQEWANAEYLLDDAWALLHSPTKAPNLDADITAGAVSKGNAVRVIVAMVLRVLRNPEGFLEESIDDYRYRRDSLISSGALHVTAAELAAVVPGRKSTRSVRLVAHGEV